ncbi:LacI family DNA-binding transcriptional regulator [Microbacterium sp. CGR1]|uniref:LacI family DNA-binding transcriptional regulator n=1 Tax=Microbacterium sp. CGR1 TaxID=1696072 RepID=UPI003DA60619
MTGKRVTITDVAAAAGVSRQTVTRAMNGMSEITASTRERVLRASEELGYRPSRFASNLARQKHHSLGVILATLRNPYYTDLAADILDMAGGLGWQTTIATSENESEIEVLTSLTSQVDAVVGYFEAPESEIARAARGIPVIFIERSATLPNIHSVQLDFDQGMAGLVEHLVATGARRFGMIDSRNAAGTYHPTARRASFEKALATLGIQAPVVASPESLQSAGAAFSELHGRHPDIDTVVVFNDMMAMGVMQQAHAMRLRIPDDVRIVGTDGLHLGALMSPPLSTLSIDRHAISEAAGDLITAALEDALIGSSSRVVVPSPLWRGSS